MITTELGLCRLKAMNVCKLFSYCSQMAKIHPHMLATSSSPPPPLPPPSSASSGGETFTVWMKSLVLNGNGFTVYNSRGEIVFRVDNYDTKCKNEVCIMDLKGRVLCTLLKRKLGMLRHWDGYRCDGETEKPWFQVKKVRKSFGGGFAWRVTAVACDTIDAQSSCFLMKGSADKSAFQITNIQGRVVAKGRRKQSVSGVMLGEDVLSLVIEPHWDHSLVVSLVAVYGLITQKI